VVEYPWVFCHVGFFRFYVDAEHPPFPKENSMRSYQLDFSTRETLAAGILILSVFAYSLNTGLAQAQQPAPPTPPAGVVPDQLPPDALGKEYSGQERANLGVTLSDNTQGKVWIRSVEPRSAADIAGLRPNDQLTALDARPIATYLDVIRYVNQKGASDDIAVHLIRNGKPGMLTASLGAQYGAPNSATSFTDFPGSAPGTAGAQGNPALNPESPASIVAGKNIAGNGIVAQAGPDAWRYKQQNGIWWYYTPNNQWLTYTNGAWNQQ
jgi:membrane-associated protease RseP (regulator of RpoE activity)